MTTQKIYKSRIEKAAYKATNKESIPDNNLIAHEKGFMRGSNFILSNLWIPVWEALPNFEEDVFITSADSNHFIPFVTCRSEDSVDADELGFINYHHYRITHWMPIPKLKGCDK